MSRGGRRPPSIGISLIPSGWILLLVHAAMALGMVYMTRVALSIHLPGLSVAAIACWVILAGVVWDTMRRTITIVRRRGVSFVRGVKVTRDDILNVTVTELAAELTTYSVDVSLPSGSISVAKSLSLRGARRKAGLLQEVIG